MTVNTVAPDTIAPTIVRPRATPASTTGEAATIAFTLGEASTSFIASDVTVSGGTLSNFARQWQELHRYVHTDKFQHRQRRGQRQCRVTDAANNPNIDGADTSNTVTMKVNTTVSDNTVPKIALSTSDANLTVGETAIITFTLNGRRQTSRLPTSGFRPAPCPSSLAVAPATAPLHRPAPVPPMVWSAWPAASYGCRWKRQC